MQQRRPFASQEKLSEQISKYEHRIESLYFDISIVNEDEEEDANNEMNQRGIGEEDEEGSESKIREKAREVLERKLSPWKWKIGKEWIKGVFVHVEDRVTTG